MSSKNLEALEVDRQAIDLRHLGYLIKSTNGDWMDLEARNKMRETREEAVKELRRRMWAEVRKKEGISEGLFGEKLKRERKRRARLGTARARAMFKDRVSGREGGGRSEMEDLGVRRSPKRDKEALLAMIARKKRRINRGFTSISGRL